MGRKRSANRRKRRSSWWLLAKGLAAGVAAVAIPIGVLAVFGEDQPDSSTRAAARGSGFASAPTTSVTTPATTAPAAASPLPSEDEAVREDAPPADTTGARNGSGSLAPAPSPTPSPPPVEEVATPEPPAAPPPTAPPKRPTPHVAPGSGDTLVVTLTGFPPNEAVRIDCWQGSGVGMFQSYTATTDSSGSSSTSVCEWVTPGDHAWVVANAPSWPGDPRYSNHYYLPE